MNKETLFYKKLDNELNNNNNNNNNKDNNNESNFFNVVQCCICARYCLIEDNSYGFCGRRKNIRGKLYYMDYNLLSSLNVDPIEKKPLYHFFPGTTTYSIGGFSCNMSCLNCQNFEISQEYSEINGFNISPLKIVENAVSNGCSSISFTYNEPTIQLEFYMEIASISRNFDLKNIFISNGYMSDESLDLILKHIGAFNVDLKSFSNDFYKNISNANLNHILDNLKKIYKNNKHLEITNLLINGKNDSSPMISSLLQFIVDELSPSVPIHFSRFFPYYKMRNISPTILESLYNAQKTAIDRGLEYVYLGNINGNQNSYCPNCGELLIKRNIYSVILMDKIEDSSCKSCGYHLNFTL
ncbi:MAG: AmmeMemoRadiSam system radical SAM enzyme [Methanobrevibacter sp.]|jgi:pyruvate formate lyase activating enzyme|nr:AmmeMemoRadiSam system radical SAM enzyme [Methanobrevibacter sp.]